MKIQQTETAIESFHQLTPDRLQRLERKILRQFHAKPNLLITREDLCTMTGMGINTVTGRVHSLIEKGRLEVHGQTYSPATKRMREVVGLPAGYKPQAELF